MRTYPELRLAVETIIKELIQDRHSEWLAPLVSLNLRSL